MTDTIMDIRDSNVANITSSIQSCNVSREPDVDNYTM